MTDQQQCSPNPNEVPASNAAAHPPSQQSLAPWLTLTPGSALLISSLPLSIGSYIGYRRSLHPSEAPASASASSSKPTLNGGMFGGKGNSILGQIIHPEPSLSNPKTASITSNPSTSAAGSRIVVSATPPAVLAARALVLGSLLSISATGLLLSGIFYTSGCNSVEDLMSKWKSWAPKQLLSMENSLGGILGISVGKERRAAKIDYEQATSGMTEEEELDYVTKKYGEEIQWDEKDNAAEEHQGVDGGEKAEQ